MRTIERTSQFKKDYKRECKGKHRLTVEAELVTVLKQLIANKPLAAKYRDHPLSNNWSDHRDCHIKPDLVLIYRLPDDDTPRWLPKFPRVWPLQTPPLELIGNGE